MNNLMKYAEQYYYRLHHTPLLRYRIAVLNQTNGTWVDVAREDDVITCFVRFLEAMQELGAEFGYGPQKAPLEFAGNTNTR